MKEKFYISFFCLFLASCLIIPGIIQAEEELPSAGLLPDNPFYFLETFFEGMRTFLTFNDLAKAERYADLAAERLAETKALINKGKTEKVEKILKRYQSQLEKSQERIDQAYMRNKNISQVSEKVGRATAKHLLVLERVLEKVPQQAKSAILRASDVSKKGQIKALESLAKEKPKIAADLYSQTIQERIKKAKEKAGEKSKENLEKTIIDFSLFRNSLKKIAENNETILGKSVSEKMTNYIKDLDELEKKTEQMPEETAKLIEKIREETVDEQIDVLKKVSLTDPEQAAEIFSQAAEERLSRAKEAKKTDKIIEEFEKYTSFGQEISKIAQGIGKDTTKIEELVAKATARHLEVLNDVYNKVPEQAKEAIEKAMVVSEKGRQKTVEVLKEKNALKNIPEIVPLPTKVKEKVIQAPVKIKEE